MAEAEGASASFFHNPFDFLVFLSKNASLHPSLHPFLCAGLPRIALNEDERWCAIKYHPAAATAGAMTPARAAAGRLSSWINGPRPSAHRVSFGPSLWRGKHR